YDGCAARRAGTPLRSLPARAGTSSHDRGHHDLDEPLGRHETRSHRRPRGELAAEEPAIDVVHRREIGDVREVDEAVNDVPGARAGVLQRAADAGEGLA